MYIRRLLVVLCLSCIASPLTAAEADDAKKLAGVWRGFVVEGRGDRPNQRRMRIELTIKGDTITGLQDGGKDLGEGTFTLKWSRDGKHLDATRTKNPGRGQTYRGIYALDGDTLKWCVSNPPGRDRPSELVSKTGQFLMILRKEK